MWFALRTVDGGISRVSQGIVNFTKPEFTRKRCYGGIAEARGRITAVRRRILSAPICPYVIDTTSQCNRNSYLA